MRNWFAPLLALLAPALAAQDALSAWNTAALDAIRALRTPPPAAARSLAIAHAAMHDAVNGIVGRYEQHLAQPTGTEGASAEAALAGAAHASLAALFPSRAAQFALLRDSQVELLPAGPARDAGLAWGVAAATQLLAARAADGATGTASYPGSTAPGMWRPTVSFGGQVRPALLPHWGTVACFVLPAGSSLRPAAPPHLASHRYAWEVRQVQALGAANSHHRTAEQTEVAQFWAYGPGTATPPGHWNEIAQQVVPASRLDLCDRARVYALLNLAMADAAVVAWECKYVYGLWRPITAIQLADQDGNPWTEPDASWTPLLPTPPFPEYVSGHSCFSAAAATVLARALGSDRIAFRVGSDDLPGVQRRYRRLSEAAWESGMSRIYGGIHFLSGNLEGLHAGQRTGTHVFDNALRPLAR